MGAVPDVQESLEFCSVSDEQFYEVDQPYREKSLARYPRPCALSRSCSASDTGIQLKYAEKSSLRPFRRSVVLLVALGKMKQPKATLFSDNDLNSILDAVFETVSFESHSVTYAVNSIYRYLRSISCEIRDTDQKCFKLEAPAQLVAMHLQGPNIQHQVRLNMALYRRKSNTSFPVALGIKGTRLYLSCVLNGQQPTLQLEEADLPKDVQGPELERFIFYRTDSGDTTQFESATHRGWYICTSPESNQPVAITNRVGEVFITNYLLTQAKH